MESSLAMAEIAWRYEWINGIDEVKWIKHYNSNHQILLVGEGDFSFSRCLAMSFGSATNIVATSLDSYDVVIKKYKGAEANLKMLASFGAHLIHGVDAIKMKLHTHLQMRKFDRIIYNFPHAGFLGRESDQRVIMKHKNLVRGFFHNASRMLRPNGEIHVSHKTAHPFDTWNIEQLAAQNSLTLLECVKFNINDYPGYNNKRGDGKNPDNPFPLGKCSTFKFTLYPTSIKSSTVLYHKFPPQPQLVVLPQRETCFRVFREYFDHARSTFGQSDGYLLSHVPYLLRIGFERCRAEDCVNLLKGLQDMSKGRIAFLQNCLLDIDRGYGV